MLTQEKHFSLRLIKKGFNLPRSIKIGLWSNEKKVKWSDEAIFTLFQSEGHPRIKRATGEVLHPSSLMSAVQA